MTEETTAATPAAADATPDAPQEQAAPKDLLDTAASDEASSQTAGDLLSDDGDTQPEGVPDEYTFEPDEGVTLNEASLDAYKAVAKDAGLSQKQFEALAKFDIERSQTAEKEAVDGWNARVDGWRQSAQNDKEFGGENFKSNVTQALKLVEKFGDAEFKALLKSPSEDNPDGLAIGNHPAVLRFLHRIGKQMLGEPDLVQGDASAQASTDEQKLRRLYPSMFKETA